MNNYYKILVDRYNQQRQNNKVSVAIAKVTETNRNNVYNYSSQGININITYNVTKVII